MKTSSFLCLILFLAACSHVDYFGKPWHKEYQSIPGRIQCELYDEGGEGVAFHDTDSVNNGSGKLNPANGNFLNEFRMSEAVDISFTKTHGIDDSPFNKTNPDPDQLYLGWTQPGEWINYTFRVVQSGIYRVSIMYTANGDGEIALSVDDNSMAIPLSIATTYNANDTIPWRQWHHWNKVDYQTDFSLKEGVHKLTIRITAHGNMNLDYLEFRKSVP